MSERVSLFDELKSGGYETCLMTSFNIDFPFYEEVLLRRMRSSGVYHHLVLVDQRMCMQALNERPPHLVGQHYSLAPMDCKKAFHPKLLMLLGKNKGLLAVGSHNITLSGFGQNLEVTNVIRFNTKTRAELLPIFKSAYQAFQTWIKDYGDNLPSDLSESLSKVPHLCPWLDGEAKNTNDDCQLLFTSKSTSNLWSQFQPAIPKSLNRIIGISAFFDKSLSVVSKLQELEAENFTLGIQQKKVQAPAHIVDIEGVNVVESSDLLSENNYHAYIHAKLLYLDGAKHQVLVSGSANFSAPAWLQTDANAEAVIVRRDEGVLDEVKSLGLDVLINATQVGPLPDLEFVEDSYASDTIKLLLIAYEDNGTIEIPLLDDWKGNVVAAYAKAYGGFDIISSLKNNKVLQIDSAVIHPGEVLWVLNNGKTISKVLLHNSTQIQQHSTTGTERKMRLALGSLGTESPDIVLLFQCIKALTSEAISTSKGSSSRKQKQSDDSNPESPDTLITELDTNKKDKTSGRYRLSMGGDIGLILDALLYNIKTGGQIPLNRGLNEDKHGRNEEGLKDSDDEIINMSIDEKNEQLDLFCQRKLKSTIKTLSQFLTINKANQSGVTAALGIMALAHQLMIQQEGHEPERKWITDEILCSLFDVICEYLLSDKDIYFSDVSEDSIYQSDEWVRVLSYSVWLSYYSGVAYRERLPISAQKEESDRLYWSNACWLYLAQHLAHDDMARKFAGERIAEIGNNPMKNWFETLKKFGLVLKTDGQLPLKTGFKLAKSPKKVFAGFRMAVDQGTNVTLASIKKPGVINGFGANYIEIV